MERKKNWVSSAEEQLTLPRLTKFTEVKEGSEGCEVKNPCNLPELLKGRGKKNLIRYDKGALAIAPHLSCMRSVGVVGFYNKLNTKHL